MGWYGGGAGEGGVMKADPMRAPEHLVRQLAMSIQPPPRLHPTLSFEQQRDAHLAQCRVWADRIWAEAYVAGAAYGSSMVTTQVRINATSEMLESLSAIMRNSPVNGT